MTSLIKYITDVISDLKNLRNNFTQTFCLFAGCPDNAENSKEKQKIKTPERRKQIKVGRSGQLV